MDWIIANREWLFGGVLVAAPIALAGWLLARRYIHRSQTQRGGNRSVNIQVGGNLEVGKGTDDGRPDSKSRR